jgi:hypothetical protein
MSEKVRILYYALWIAHPLLQAGIAAIMLHRQMHRRFKFFFAYVVTQILTFAVIFPAFLRQNYSVYFYLYWFSNAISVVLGFKIIHEIFLDVFRPFHTLRDLGTVLFKWAGLVMLLVAGVVSISSSSSQMLPWMQAIVTTQRCIRIIQVGMVLFLLFFSRYLGVSRRQHSFGLALGFGAFAMIELGLIASWVGNHVAELSTVVVNMAAYNVTLLIWLGYVLTNGEAREEGGILLKPQRWEQSLSDIQHPLPADSLIPMFEGMVDRALSRTRTSPSVPGNLEAAGTGSRAAVIPLRDLDLPLSDRVASKT